MKQTANARFVIKNWDEKAYSEGQDLPKAKIPRLRASLSRKPLGSRASEREDSLGS